MSQKAVCMSLEADCMSLEAEHLKTVPAVIESRLGYLHFRKMQDPCCIGIELFFYHLLKFTGRRELLTNPFPLFSKIKS